MATTEVAHARWPVVECVQLLMLILLEFNTRTNESALIVLTDSGANFVV